MEKTVKKDPWFRNRLIRDGIYRALHEEMSRRPEIYIMGEGSHMKVHFDAKDVERDFGDRVITLPISEDGNNNFAVGMSLAGLVPVVDIISSDFLYRAMDSICNTMAKGRAVGRPGTMVIRAEFMTGGPTSGQRIEALFAHVPGLRVAVPSNPADAYNLMKEALTYDGVTVFFEDRMIADATMPSIYLPGSGKHEGFWKTGCGARVMRLGGDVVVASYGITQRLVEDTLIGDDCTVIDLRHLYPLDTAAVIEQVAKRGKLLVVEPDVKFLGIGAELCAEVVEKLQNSLHLKIKRLGAPRVTIPSSRERHDEILPTAEQIKEAFEELRK
jgi:pyruvate/2-oxoglutarate/acetoin dehydrogenase E1 component